ncbi:MAG TPA: rRNA adenine dimethyltransferase family protein [Candidatus Paceibacterota bacterium]|nr:rRNA adenine dimethyltransferase family protein [Candidatus Paceibacterota bacterium]
METKAKKSLGQHWLKEEKYLDLIVDTADPTADEIVLEIGPGTGLLTEKLLKLAGKVIAVEKDHELVDSLRKKFKEEIKNSKIDIIEKDILDFDPTSCFSSSREFPRPKGAERLAVSPPQPLGNGSPANPSALSPAHKKSSYKIVANIPYYITGAILKKFLTAGHQPEKMVLLVQKEVAERIVARDGKESILSISVKVYGKPRLVLKVPAGAFSPPPKVDSAILEIKNISKNFFTKEKIEEKAFFRVVRVGFSSKRKTLLNNLGALFGRKETQIGLKNCQIAENTRAERLTLPNWLCITREFTKAAKK